MNWSGLWLLSFSFIFHSYLTLAFYRGGMLQPISLRVHYGRLSFSNAGCLCLQSITLIVRFHDLLHAAHRRKQGVHPPQVYQFQGDGIDARTEASSPDHARAESEVHVL